MSIVASARSLCRYTGLGAALLSRYVWHCHVLEHEDNEMMRPYDVVG